MQLDLLHLELCIIFCMVYDGLANYRITIINKPKRMLSKNKQNDVIASPMTYKINSSDTEISYSMWLYLEDFGFKYGKEKHIFSHGYNPRFYSKFKDHRIMIKLNETTNTIRVIITSSKEDTDWCSKMIMKMIIVLILMVKNIVHIQQKKVDQKQLPILNYIIYQ